MNQRKIEIISWIFRIIIGICVVGGIIYGMYYWHQQDQDSSTFKIVCFIMFVLSVLACVVTCAGCANRSATDGIGGLY